MYNNYKKVASIDEIELPNGTGVELYEFNNIKIIIGESERYVSLSRLSNKTKSTMPERVIEIKISSNITEDFKQGLHRLISNAEV